MVSLSRRSASAQRARAETSTAERRQALRRLCILACSSERGSALLTGLSLIMILSLLGVAAFEVATMEANLVTRDQWELQAFYCAEAQAARLYNLYDLGC